MDSYIDAYRYNSTIRQVAGGSGENFPPGNLGRAHGGRLKEWLQFGQESPNGFADPEQTPSNPDAILEAYDRGALDLHYHFDLRRISHEGIPTDAPKFCARFRQDEGANGGSVYTSPDITLQVADTNPIPSVSRVKQSHPFVLVVPGQLGEHPKRFVMGVFPAPPRLVGLISLDNTDMQLLCARQSVIDLGLPVRIVTEGDGKLDSTGIFRVRVEADLNDLPRCIIEGGPKVEEDIAYTQSPGWRHVFDLIDNNRDGVIVRVGYRFDCEGRFAAISLLPGVEFVCEAIDMFFGPVQFGPGICEAIHD